MNINKSIKFFGMMCICGMFTAAGTQTVLAGPADGFEAEMVAKVEAADISIYAEENEGSEVVAMAHKGGIYDVVESGSDGLVRVTAGDKEGYLKTDGIILEEADEAAEAAQQAQETQTSKRQQVVDYALQFVGGRYKYGGSDPHTGVDCSGFTRYVMQNGAGVSLNRSSGSQAAQGVSISAAQMQPGDLIFYGNGKRINHVALYIGNGQIVHASTERTGIKISNWNYRAPVKIVSVLG